MQKWMPKPVKGIARVSAAGGGKKGGAGRAGMAKVFLHFHVLVYIRILQFPNNSCWITLYVLTESRGGKKVKGGDDHTQLQVDPESGPELKEALEVPLPQ